MEPVDPSKLQNRTASSAGESSQMQYSGVPPPYNPNPNQNSNQYQYPYQYPYPYPVQQQQPLQQQQPDMTTYYQAQNPNIVIISQPTHATEVRETFGCHYFWSCMVFWFCWFIFGGIAFLFAMVGSKKSAHGDQESARKYGQTSVWMNVIGVLTGCAAWGVMIWWLCTYAWECYYSVYGICYQYRNCYWYYSDCTYYQPAGYYYNGCCYYN